MAEPDLMADASVWDIPGQPSPVDTIYKSLNQSLGTAYDTSDTSNVTAETKAQARALAAVWRSNRRMMLQWDPNYIDLFLDRWEAIFGINHPHGQSDADRRTILKDRFRLLSGRSSLLATVTAILGANLVGIVYTSINDNYIRWPATVPTGTAFPDDWISNTAHILIRVQILALTEIAFFNLMDRMGRVLDDMLPAYASWNWGTYDEGGVEGFFLDEPTGAGPPPHNLNYETFSS